MQNTSSLYHKISIHEHKYNETTVVASLMTLDNTLHNVRQKNTLLAKA